MPEHLSSSVLSTLRRLTLALATVAVIAVSAPGCEKKTDSSLQSAMDNGAGFLRGGEATKASAALQPATTEKTAAGGTLGLQFTLGHAKLAEAREKANALDAVYLDVIRIESEISQTATAISIGNTLVDGYRKQDPAEARERIRERIAEAQGGPDKPVWINTGPHPIGTLAASKQKVSQFQELVASKKDQIRKLEADRATALQETDKLMEAVDALKGRQAVDAFTKASDAKKKVSIISGQIDSAAGELVTLEGDLSIHQGQLNIVEKYIAGLTAQDQVLVAGYEGVAKQISNQLGVSKTAVGTGDVVGTGGAADGEAAATIAAKAKDLSSRLEAAAALHTEAEALFKEAASAYQAAFTEATTLRTELSSRMELYRGKSKLNEDMIASQQQTTWPSVYRTQQGIALAGLADLYARRYSVLALQESLSTSATAILKTTGIELPAGLTSDAAAVKAARDSAVENYGKSITELDGSADNIQGRDPEKRRQAATIARIFVYNAWSQMLIQAGDPAEAKLKIDEAKKLRDNLISEGDPKLPFALPGELAITPTTAPTNP